MEVARRMGKRDPELPGDVCGVALHVAVLRGKAVQALEKVQEIKRGAREIHGENAKEPARLSWLPINAQTGQVGFNTKTSGNPTYQALAKRRATLGEC
jgi:hypothetical protein